MPYGGGPTYIDPTQGDFTPNIQPLDPQTPPAPVDVKLRLLSFADATWRMQWRDAGENLSSVRGPDRRAWMFDWMVAACPVSKIAPAGSQTDFPVQVRDLSTVVGSRPGMGTGKILTYTHTDKTFVDSYVIVYGLSKAGLLGPPSVPLRLILSSDATTIPGETLSQGLGFSLVSDPAGNFYFDLAPQYKPPAVTSDFDGVELHVGNWCGTTLIEAGPLGVWDRVSRLQNFRVRLPEDTGLGSGVAHFTNGNATVTKVSGSNFAAPWAGRTMGVHGSTPPTTVTINTVTPTTTLTLTSPWGFATGDYAFVTYNQMSFYYVPVGPMGQRRSDPTGSAVIVL